jgi:ferredoxin
MIFKIEFTKSGEVLEYCTIKHANLSILDMAFDHELPVRAGCRSGYCTTCQTKLLSGEVKYFYDPPPVPADNGAVLLCSCYPVSDLVIEG